MVLIVVWEVILFFNEFGFSFLFKSVWNFVVNDGKGDYGVLLMIVGILVSLVLVLFIVVLFGVGIVIFLSENFIFKKVVILLIFMVELLVVIFSVVYGLWGIYVLFFFLELIEVIFGWYLGWILFFFIFDNVCVGGLGMFFAVIILLVMILLIIIVIFCDFFVSLLFDLW